MTDTQEAPTQETQTEAPGATETEQTAPPADEQKVEETEKPAEQEDDQDSDLPEWAQKERTKLRAENAEWRRKLRELEAKSADEVKAALADANSKIAELEHQTLADQVARQHNLPEELAARLQGTSKEELEADAKSLARFITKPGVVEDPSGGLDPSNRSNDYSNLSPAELAARVRESRPRKF